MLAGIAAGASWADPETDPPGSTGRARQAAAAIPFQVVDGRPVNPCEHDRHPLRPQRVRALGRGTRRRCPGHRHRRPHGRRWVAHGRTRRRPRVGAARRARRPGRRPDRRRRPGAGRGNRPDRRPDGDPWQTCRPRYVPDPRASDEAWMVTVLTRFDFGDPTPVPRGDRCRRRPPRRVGPRPTATPTWFDAPGTRLSAARCSPLTATCSPPPSTTDPGGHQLMTAPTLSAPTRAPMGRTDPGRPELCPPAGRAPARNTIRRPSASAPRRPTPSAPPWPPTHRDAAPAPLRHRPGAHPPAAARRRPQSPPRIRRRRSSTRPARKRRCCRAWRTPGYQHHHLPDHRRPGSRSGRAGAAWPVR